MRCLVVGNPRLPSAISETWGWQHNTSMQKEALMVGDMLHAHTLTDIQVIQNNNNNCNLFGKIYFHFINFFSGFQRGCVISDC